MSAILRPVGPEQPKTYWLRRVVTLLIVVVVAVVLILLARAAMGGSPDAAPPAGPSPSNSVAASGEKCDKAVLQISTEMSARNYAAGQNPVIKVTVKNASDQPCIVDVGEAARAVAITSGTDPVWTSTDCPAEPAAREVLLQAQGIDASEVTWPRVRSAATCPTGLPEPGAGTYHVVAKLGDVASEDTVFSLS